MHHAIWQQCAGLWRRAIGRSFWGDAKSGQGHRIKNTKRRSGAGVSYALCRVPTAPSSYVYYGAQLVISKSYCLSTTDNMLIGLQMDNNANVVRNHKILAQFDSELWRKEATLRCDYWLII